MALTTLLGVSKSNHCWRRGRLVFHKVLILIISRVLKWPFMRKFVRDKSRLGFPIAKSVGYTVRYHLDSLAFGSLLIAIMKFVRMLFNYIERKLRNSTTDCFGLVSCITCFCKCCLYCFEKFLQGLCSNAYIEIGSPLFTISQIR